MAAPPSLQLDVEVGAAMGFPRLRRHPDVPVSIRKATSARIWPMFHSHHLSVPVRRRRKRGRQIPRPQRSVGALLTAGHATCGGAFMSSLYSPPIFRPLYCKCSAPWRRGLPLGRPRARRSCPWPSRSPLLGGRGELGRRLRLYRKLHHRNRAGAGLHLSP